MKSKKLIYLHILFFFLGMEGTVVLNAQSFTPQVIGASGTYALSSAGSMSWTIGEVMTETYSASGNYFFTQGFHQPDTITILNIIDLPKEYVSVYPNPVVSDLIIDLSGIPDEHILFVYDMMGQLLIEEKILAGQQFKISFGEFANGMYLLNVVNARTLVKSSFKINKLK